MKNKLPVILIILALAGIGGIIIYQKSQVATPTPPSSDQTTTSVKKVDLSTQPKWVQDLDVTAKKGVSANGLNNVTITVKNLPVNIASAVTYVLQYQTSNKGTQGALSMTPIDISGKSTFTKTIDLGTCSTKSCVRHEGVTSVDLELDFTAIDGSQPVWEKPLSLQ